jgi:hypothetical protein
MTVTDKKVSDMEIGPKWIFWVYGVNTSEWQRINYKVLSKCIVSKGNIEIISTPELVIELNAKTKCEYPGGTRYHAAGSRITTADGQIYYIYPANPYYPQIPTYNGAEADEFLEVVNSLLKEHEINIPGNPYEREDSHKNPYGEGLIFDPDTSPWIYLEKFKKKVDIKAITIKVILTIIGLFLGLLIFLLLVNGI